MGPALRALITGCVEGRLWREGGYGGRVAVVGVWLTALLGLNAALLLCLLA